MLPVAGLRANLPLSGVAAGRCTVPLVAGIGTVRQKLVVE